jgi:hypothetical protein
VEVIGDQCPGIDLCSGRLYEIVTSTEEPAIFIIFEYRAALYASDHNVMKGSWNIQTWLSGHGRFSFSENNIDKIMGQLNQQRA